MIYEAKGSSFVVSINIRLALILSSEFDRRNINQIFGENA